VQAVRVILDILQRHCLGADMPATEGVQWVALDRRDRQAAVFGLGGFQGQATDGFAQMAGTVVESLGHGQSLYQGFGLTMGRDCGGHQQRSSRESKGISQAMGKREKMFQNLPKCP